jgi:glucose/arabinose dehydrogenase
MRGFATALMLLASVGRVGAATEEPGYVEEVYAQNFGAPTAMAFAPDGRLFISEQAGQLRVVDQGQLLSEPFLTLDVDSEGERGLLGVAFDPNFASNHHVYVYYTAKTPNIHNRVSRFTADGNTALPGSEVAILDLEPLTTSTGHNGGAMRFGNDGRLYVAVGDNRRARTRKRSRIASARSCASTPTAPSPPTTRSTRSRQDRIARSGRTVCAIRSGWRYSRPPGAYSSTTSARTPGRKSTRA